MSAFEVKIVTLEPMLMIGANGFGEGPEDIAWRHVAAWMKDTSRLDDAADYRFFGYNNPDPAPGSSNYGYDQWIVVDQDAEVGEGMMTMDFPGGLYAVARCTHPQNIFPTWQKLIQWRENSAYKPATHQWLEECMDGAKIVHDAVKGNAIRYDVLTFDLYLPIAA